MVVPGAGAASGHAESRPALPVGFDRAATLLPAHAQAAGAGAGACAAAAAEGGSCCHRGGGGGGGWGGKRFRNKALAFALGAVAGAFAGAAATSFFGKGKR